MPKSFKRRPRAVLTGVLIVSEDDRLKMIAIRADNDVVLRPATQSALHRLVQAATQNDVELDAALADLGVLPPLELEQIRACLQLERTGLVAGVNADGHRLITLTDGDHPLAWIYHDGRVLVAQHERM